MVEVLTAEMVVTIDSYSLQRVVSDFYNCDIEGSSTEVEYQLSFCFKLLEQFELHCDIKCSRYRFFKNVLTIQVRQLASFHCL